MKKRIRFSDSSTDTAGNIIFSQSWDKTPACIFQISKDGVNYLCMEAGGPSRSVESSGYVGEDGGRSAVSIIETAGPVAIVLIFVVGALTIIFRRASAW